MAEIILAFLAVIGIGLMGSMILDAFYFRKNRYEFPIIIDLRQDGLEQAWNKLEALAMARKTAGGRGVINNLIILVSESNPAINEALANHYLRVFDLPGTVFTDEEDWSTGCQNTPETEGTKPS